MKYKKNELPECPHCGDEIDTFVSNDGPIGVQNIGLHDVGGDKRS